MYIALNLSKKDKDDIISLWEQYTLQAIDEKVDFFESGGDSLAAINLIIEIQKLYNVEINLESFMRNPTINFLYTVITKDHRINE